MNSKRAIIASVLIPIVVFYLGISFFTWNLNPGMWDKDCRFIFVLLTTVIPAGMVLSIVLSKRK